MARIPIVPTSIRVHLGAPESNAENVTVSFSSYIKNVASSEIYSTWPEASIRANVYCQISFALNRIYTEWYPAKGFNFDITNNTFFDQKFIYQRNIYDNISRIVDDIFNDYLRKEGTVNPFFAQYCNGTTVTCDGLSQWGSVDLANKGLNSVEIVRFYYGDEIEIVVDAPIADNTPSYPGTPLKLGDLSESVRRMQIYLNRISVNYPAIPKIPQVLGQFNESTEDAVVSFQRIFNLTADGIIGRATWYKIIFIYDAVTKIAELNAEGTRYEDLPRQFTAPLTPGTTGGQVFTLQYFLSVVGTFSSQVPTVTIDGVYGQQTTTAVTAFQRLKGLPQTGITDRATWEALYSAYDGILEYLIQQSQIENIPIEPYPGVVLKRGDTGPSVLILNEYLNYLSKFIFDIPPVPITQLFSAQTQSAVTIFQRIFDLPATGEADERTWNEIARAYRNIRISQIRLPGQFPGYVIEQE